MNNRDSHLVERSPEGAHNLRVGYVLKRYPRFSETFVVNEIIAHEAAGLDVGIFALRPTVDTHFQHSIANVRAAITHLRYGGIRAEALWKEIDTYGRENSALWSALPRSSNYTAVEIYQAILLAREVRSRRIEHLHAHFATTATAVARLAARLTEIPYSVTAHAKDIFHESVDEAMLEQKLADADSVITVSDFNVSDLSRRFPHLADKIHRIYNGLPLPSYPFSAPLKRVPTIVAVGRLVEKKGFSDLIEACSILERGGTDFRCEIIGGGERESVLRSQIQRLNLDNHVALLGPLPHREAHRRIQESAVCVAPCITASTGDRDGLPTVLLEAMALGTPCISTNVTGITEVVRHGETGLVTPEQQPVMLAESIRMLLRDENLGVNLANAARRLVEEQFDIRKNSAVQRRLFGETDCSSEPKRSFAEVG